MLECNFNNVKASKNAQFLEDERKMKTDTSRYEKINPLSMSIKSALR